MGKNVNPRMRGERDETRKEKMKERRRDNKRGCGNEDELRCGQRRSGSMMVRIWVETRGKWTEGGRTGREGNECRNDG